MNIDEILMLVGQYSKDIIDLRREFHKYPEPGWLEFRTTARIVEILKNHKININYGPDIINKDYVWSYPEDLIQENINRAIEQGANPEIMKNIDGYTGVIAEFDTGKAGPVVALRFDIDCNEINESIEDDHRPAKEGFRSVNRDCMHACGHDGHASIGIITCLILNDIKDKLTGKIKVIFQPGEEGSKGAQSIAESGILKDVDIFLSGHLGMGLNTGDLVALYKEFLASTKFDLCFNGVSSHAANSPEEGKNAIVAASTAILGIYSLCQDGRGTSYVNAGTIKGGAARNIIADKVDLEMETRGMTTDIEQHLYKSALNCAEGAAKMYGCTYESVIKGYAPNTDSDDELLETIEFGVSNVQEITKFIPHKKFAGSEDVAYHMKKVKHNGGKAAFMGFGADIAASHHNVKFDFDEDALILAVKVYISILWRLLGQNK